MLDREQERAAIDYQFKRIYGRYPSVSERQQFMKSRPRSVLITTADIEKLRELKTVPTWMELRDANKARERLTEPPIDT